MTCTGMTSNLRPARSHWIISMVHKCGSVLAAVCLVLFAQRTWAVDTMWNFDGDGNWAEAAKWSNGQPIDETFSVFIDDGDSNVAVTLNASRTIGGLTLGTN